MPDYLERARKAQEAHDKRVPVQLRMEVNVSKIGMYRIVAHEVTGKGEMTEVFSREYPVNLDSPGVTGLEAHSHAAQYAVEHPEYEVSMVYVTKK